MREPSWLPDLENLAGNARGVQERRRWKNRNYAKKSRMAKIKKDGAPSDVGSVSPLCDSVVWLKVFADAPRPLLQI